MRWMPPPGIYVAVDRKSTRLNSSHRCTSYAVFCLKKKMDADTTSSPPHQLDVICSDVPEHLRVLFLAFFFFNDPAPTEIYTLSLHDALPICPYVETITAVREPASLQARFTVASEFL